MLGTLKTYPGNFPGAFLFSLCSFYGRLRGMGRRREKHALYETAGVPGRDKRVCNKVWGVLGREPAWTWVCAKTGGAT